LVGAIFTDKAYDNIEDVELGLDFAEGFERVYPLDYRKSLTFLSKYCPTTPAQEKAVKDGVDLLNAGESFSVISARFSRLLGKRPTTTAADFSEFDVPRTPKR
jgi:hypothetical protein